MSVSLSGISKPCPASVPHHFTCRVACPRLRESHIWLPRADAKNKTWTILGMLIC